MCPYYYYLCVKLCLAFLIIHLLYVALFVIQLPQDTSGEDVEVNLEIGILPPSIIPGGSRPPSVTPVGMLSRPASQLSHQASSGYGSTRSRKDEIINSRSHSNDSSKSKESPKMESRRFKKQTKPSQSYSSMRIKNKSTNAKNALTKTAAYFSMRLPGSKKLTIKAKDSHTESNNILQNEGNHYPAADANNSHNRIHDNTSDLTIKPQPDLITSEAKHTVSSKRSSPSTFTVESTQTSKIVLHHQSLLNNNDITESNPNLLLHTPIKNHDLSKDDNTYTPNPNQVNYPWSSQSNNNLSNLDNISQDFDANNVPVPAPRNGNEKIKHTYQNLPLSTKEKTNQRQHQYVPPACPEVCL